MNRVEETLKRMTPREPSRDYVERGLSRLTAGLPEHSYATRHWRIAAIVLAVMLTSSVALNVVQWSVSGSAGAEETTTTDERPPIKYAAYSVLRPEGDAFIHEVRFRTFDERKTNDD